MDRRSFDLNYENNILLHDPALTSTMRARQDAYIADSRPVTLADGAGLGRGASACGTTHWPSWDRSSDPRPDVSKGARSCNPLIFRAERKDQLWLAGDTSGRATSCAPETITKGSTTRRGPVQP